MPGEIIVFSLAMILSYIILKHDKSYKGNQFFAICFLFFGLYGFSMFIYDLGINDKTIIVMYLLSLAFISLGVLFFVISMQIFLEGVAVSKKPLIRSFILITIIIIIIVLSWPNGVEVINDDPTTKKNIIANVLIVAWVYIMMFYNTNKLSKGLKAVTKEDTEIREHIKNLYIGEILGLFCPFWAVVGNIINIFNPEIAVYFTSMIYVFFALVMIKMTLTLKNINK